MTKETFISIMNTIVAEVASFENWLDQVEKAFGDGAVQTILQKTNPYLSIELISTITGYDRDILFTKVCDGDSDWDIFWDNSHAEEEA